MWILLYCILPWKKSGDKCCVKKFFRSRYQGDTVIDTKYVDVKSGEGSGRNVMCMNVLSLFEIWGSYGGEDVDSGLLGRNTVFDL
jgi:hypothetical protein